LIYNYNGTSLPFDGARTSYIGWTAPKDNFHHQLSGTSNAGNIFEELGNTYKSSEKNLKNPVFKSTFFF
jgi:hypothetical protein